VTVMVTVMVIVVMILAVSMMTVMVSLEMTALSGSVMETMVTVTISFFVIDERYEFVDEEICIRGLERVVFDAREPIVIDGYICRCLIALVTKETCWA